MAQRQQRQLRPTRGPPSAEMAARERANGRCGELTIATPRDRNVTFKPQLIGKHQRGAPGFDHEILALYTKGMTTRDIQEIMQELYDVEIFAALISHLRDHDIVTSLDLA